MCTHNGTYIDTNAHSKLQPGNFSCPKAPQAEKSLNNFIIFSDKAITWGRFLEKIMKWHSFFLTPIPPKQTTPPADSFARSRQSNYQNSLTSWTSPLDTPTNAFYYVLFLRLSQNMTLKQKRGFSWNLPTSRHSVLKMFFKIKFPNFPVNLWKSRWLKSGLGYVGKLKIIPQSFWIGHKG